MAVPARGLQTIRTMSAILGSGTHSNERHVHQFQLAALELERTRRQREKVVACQRVRDLEARLVEIDKLMQQHDDALRLTGRENVRSPNAPAAVQAAMLVSRVLRY